MLNTKGPTTYNFSLTPDVYRQLDMMAVKNTLRALRVLGPWSASTYDNETKTVLSITFQPDGLVNNLVALSVIQAAFPIIGKAGYHVDYSEGKTDTEPCYVNVYSMTREYGGPEEGGWWYDAGSWIKTISAANVTHAEAIKDQLSKDYPRTGKRNSVLRGEDYDIRIEDHPGRDFPAERPFYQ
jgi:hypothetical protein